jgi:hypothetical protein
MSFTDAGVTLNAGCLARKKAELPSAPETAPKPTSAISAPVAAADDAAPAGDRTVH